MAVGNLHDTSKYPNYRQMRVRTILRHDAQHQTQSIHAAGRNLDAGANLSSIPPFSKNAFAPSCGSSPGKTSSVACCCALSASANYTTRSNPWPTR